MTGTGSGDALDALHPAWRELLIPLCSEDGVDAIGEAVIAAWAQPSGRYHDLNHLRDVLHGVDQLADHAADPIAVRLAAWYHDVITRRDCMGGFVRFRDGDWSWKSSMTGFLFDFLEDTLPEGPARQEVHELNEHNVLMLDLRDPSRSTMVDLIADQLLSWVARNAADPEALRKGYGELVDLAKLQQDRNQASAEFGR